MEGRVLPTFVKKAEEFHWLILANYDKQKKKQRNIAKEILLINRSL